MEYRSRTTRKFDLIVDIGTHPTFMLEAALHNPEFINLKEVMGSTFGELEDCYERLWIEASRGGVIVGYALLDLFLTKDIASRDIKKTIQVKNDLHLVKTGQSGAIREIEAVDYDYEALIEIKKAIDILLWKNSIELEL